MSGQQFGGNGLPGSVGARDDSQDTPTAGKPSSVPVAVQRVPFPSGENGRDRLGRFAPGNTGGPGRPHAARNWRGAFRRAVTPEMMQDVFAGMVEQARRGNTQAAALLMAYGLGRPKEPIIGDQDMGEERKREALRRIARKLLGLEPAASGRADHTPDEEL